jgi:hypothetical protein
MAGPTSSVALIRVTWLLDNEVYLTLLSVGTPYIHDVPTQVVVVRARNVWGNHEY